MFEHTGSKPPSLTDLVASISPRRAWISSVFQRIPSRQPLLSILEVAQTTAPAVLGVLSRAATLHLLLAHASLQGFRIIQLVWPGNLPGDKGTCRVQSENPNFRNQFFDAAISVAASWSCCHDRHISTAAGVPTERGVKTFVYVKVLTHLRLSTTCLTTRSSTLLGWFSWHLVRNFCAMTLPSFLSLRPCLWCYTSGISAADHAFGIVVGISLLLHATCEFVVSFEHQF